MGRGRAGISEWPLVGREDEIALACESVAAGRGVVLTGRPGVGKTRLAHEILAQAATERSRTEWIAATESASRVPLGAVAHLLPSTAIGRGRDAMLQGIAAAFQRESERGPLLLGVDDAHLLDDGSATLVHLLASTGTASVVVTVRSGEPVSDSIVALWKDGPATLIALQALSRSEVERIATSVLDGPVDGSLLHMLWRSSGGNALYLRELVRHGLESGSLRPGGGLWRWHGGLEAGQRLQDLVTMSIGALADAEWAALELVALGEPLPVACLHELGVAEVAERLERRGVLASRRRVATEVGLGHPLFGEVVRARMPARRIDEVRLELARALEATSDGNAADEFRIVLWRADAGDRTRPEQMRVAARRAWSLWAPDVAERLARAALDAGPDLEAGYLLGEALHDLGRPDDALAAWDAVQDLPGPDRIRAFVAVGQASALKFHHDRADAGAAVLRRALDRVDDPGARNVITGALAFFGATTAGAIDGVPEMPAGGAPSAALAAALQLASTGQLDAAERTVEIALTTEGTWSGESPTVALLLRLARTWARVLGGHVREAEAEADERYARAVAERVDYPRISWCLARGVAAMARGLPKRATSALREGVEVTGSDDRGWLRPMHAYLSMAAALEGDVGRAEEHERLAEEGNLATEGLFGVDVRRARGWVHAARGELSAATDAAWAAADHGAATKQAALEALALHDVARFGHAADVVDRLVDVAGRVEGLLAPALAAHVIALVADDGAGLDAAAVTFESLGFGLFAAEARAGAAAAHLLAGRKASAYAARDRARKLAAEQCEGASTPALAAIGDGRGDLTGREREIAELAASGLASREIAARLGIATRTVDNLLGRVYVKLAVSGRPGLVDLFDRVEHTDARLAEAKLARLADGESPVR